MSSWITLIAPSLIPTEGVHDVQLELEPLQLSLSKLSSKKCPAPHAQLLPSSADTPSPGHDRHAP
eukprot:CAMPEP_0180383842 /NCGR_PEP_ID=MMETSP0989-20121125/28190_1 /TAXON_ID=697907 /ORGANISM="non described non described, Strain CCMP2293" /LENGTH=64 /DNA_ID=CAMNT_0022384203 /DNA_START=407 /DNA_END=597 /DNA_ORIENTATION=-